SQNDTFTPPGWFDWAPTIVRSIRVLGGLPSSLLKKHEFLFGVMMWLYPPPLPQACWAHEPPLRRQLLCVAVVQVWATFWMLCASEPESAGLTGEVLKVNLLRYTMFLPFSAVFFPLIHSLKMAVLEVPSMSIAIVTTGPSVESLSA